MDTSIGTEELKQLLKSNTVLLLDVRRKSDYDADPETIPGASWRNPEQVGAWGQEIPKGQQVVVYCVLPKRETNRSSVSRMSPTRWPALKGILKREPRTVAGMRCAWWSQLPGFGMILPNETQL